MHITNQIFLSGHEFKENIRGLIILGCQATPTGSKVQGIRINFLDCSVSLNAKVYFSSKLLLVARNSSKRALGWDLLYKKLGQWPMY